MNDFVMTKKKFSDDVETIVSEKSLTYIEAVIYLCDSLGIDPSESKKFLTPTVRDKIEFEAMQLNLLPKTPTLPMIED